MDIHAFGETDGLGVESTEDVTLWLQDKSNMSVHGDADDVQRFLFLKENDREAAKPTLEKQYRFPAKRAYKLLIKEGGPLWMILLVGAVLDWLCGSGGSASSGGS